MPHYPVPRMLEVDPEVALKVQERARARGVSIDEYLLELTAQNAKDTERKKRPSSQERVRLALNDVPLFLGRSDTATHWPGKKRQARNYRVVPHPSYP